MGQNMSTTDRVLRTFVAAPLLVLAGVLVGPTAVLSWVCYVLAAVMLGTSAITWCPLYALFGLSTRRRGAVTTPPADTPRPADRRRGRPIRPVPGQVAPGSTPQPVAARSPHNGRSMSAVDCW